MLPGGCVTLDHVDYHLSGGVAVGVGDYDIVVGEAVESFKKRGALLIYGRGVERCRMIGHEQRVAVDGHAYRLFKLLA